MMLFCLVASGCTLGTPGTTVTVVSDCPFPIGVGLGFSVVDGEETIPAAVETDLFEKARVLLEEPGDVTSALFPTLTEDVDEIYVDMTVDAGGEFGLWFVVALPVKAIDDFEYELLDGPVVIAGDRCPKP